MIMIRYNKVSVQDVKMTYLGHRLIMCLPDDNTFGYAARYYTNMKHIEDLHWLLNSNVLYNIWDHSMGFSQLNNWYWSNYS